MRKVKVEAAVYVVASGLVGLTAEQAKSRTHNLAPVKGQVDPDPKSKTFGAGVYEVVRPIQFKRGEEFGYSGEVAKNGLLHDPQAEAEHRQGGTEEVKAAVLAERQRCAVEYNAKLRKAVESMRAELEASMRESLQASIRAELEPRLRAELEAQLKDAGKKK
jgi:hypothetical protein